MPEIQFDSGQAQANMEALAENPYPGRLIAMGVCPDNRTAMQVYAVMGRSENSRNRILKQEGDDVRTEPFDASKVVDPSLIIYNALSKATRYSGLMSHEQRVTCSVHLVSNGDQTDSAYNRIASVNDSAETLGDSFRKALTERDFEPDAPNYTPRITGMLALGHYNTEFDKYAYSIIRRNPVTSKSEHTFGGGFLGEMTPGYGICYHTYSGDGEPLPAFEGSPYAVPVGETAVEVAQTFWDTLDTDNRVAIVTKAINKNSGAISYAIINALEAEV